MDFPTFESVIDFINRRLSPKDYALGRVYRLFKEMQICRLPCYVIHVAGTNGKGSVCAILEHVYRKAGYSVAFYSSPHLVDICERIQCLGQNISQEDFVRHFCKVHEVAQKLEGLNANDCISHFEYLTAIACSYFKEKCPQIVILETGLGGRCDATTVIDADLTVMTTIHYDHQSYLGHTLSEIAFEKAGILMPQIPLILGDIPDEALHVIQERARTLKVAIVPTHATDISDEEWSTYYAHLPLYQRRNLATALAVIQDLQKVFPVPLESWWQQSPKFYWPCRWECFQNAVGAKIVLDGAHNLEGAEAVLNEIQRSECLKNPFQQLIFGSIEMKRARDMLALLGPYFRSIYLVVEGYERHLSAEDFRSCIPEKMTERTHLITLDHVERLLGSPDNKLVTGSLYLLGEIMKNFAAVFF